MRNWSFSSTTSKRRPLPTTKRRRREPARVTGTDKKGIVRTDTVLYWPEFEFDFRLDIQRLLPHIAAIEGYQEAASNRVRPPQWREQPALTSMPALPFKAAEASPVDLAPEQRPRPDSIDMRKQQLLIR